MPELPEVETISNQLSKTVPNLVIRDVWSDWSKTLQVLKHDDHIKIKRDNKNFKGKEADKMLKLFREEIVGRKIKKIERKGKNILFYLSGDHMMLAHQKMTGHFLLGRWSMEDGTPKSTERGILDDRINGYIHVIFYLSDGTMLALSDLRKFAKVIAGPKKQILALEEIRSLGPEPLEESFSFQIFKEILKNKKGKIKTVLMDPKTISGLGNIYTDEVLWEAKVHPETEAGKISDAKLKKMHESIKDTLRFSIKLRGDSMSDFRDLFGKRGGFQNHHKAYGRKGEPCQRCKTKLERVKVGGRSAVFCLKCQVKL